MRQARIFYKDIEAGRLIETDDGLISEGWLLMLLLKAGKCLNDLIGFLYSCYQNCIGAVSVILISLL
ncbi:hypothetical protein DSL64_07960 [Dyadobacter luteus]|uniref:Uncharacterized protein n=1 Tax=Dyadobacter luteus TaxID=2259619 RepID=A0A3D8YF13_9BACT|nr:hypothetical protein DSL64_07960 [Dyadobacter luteus]